MADDNSAELRVPLVAYAGGLALAVVGALLVDWSGLTGNSGADRAWSFGWTAAVITAFAVSSRRSAVVGRRTLPIGVAAVLLGVGYGTAPIVVIAAAAVAMASAVLWALAARDPRFGARVTIGMWLGGATALVAATVVPSDSASPGWRALLAALPFAVVLADGLSTAYRRARGGRSIVEPGRDTVADRMRFLRIERSRARAGVEVAHLACVTAFLLGGLAIAGLGAAAAVALVAAVAVLALGQFGNADLRSGRRRRRRAPVVLVSFVVGTVVVSAGAAAAAVLLAAPSLRTGVRSATDALSAARRGEVVAAQTAFFEALAPLEESERDLDGGLAQLGRLLPVAGANLEVVHQLASDAAELSELGATLVEVEQSDSLRIVGGRLPIDQLEALAGDLERAAAALRRTERHLAGARTRDVLPPLRAELDRFSPRIEGAAGDATRAADAARLVPGLLGGASDGSDSNGTASDGPASDGSGERRYFLAVQNNAEARATGGFFGNYGELVARDGRITVERFGRIRELNEANAGNKSITGPAEYVERYGAENVDATWQNVNLTPDLPTVADVVGQLYPQSGGRPVDGLVTIDPLGLSALLRLTGPVVVAAWPEPISADNVVDVTLRAAYLRFDETPARERFLGDVADAVIRRATTVDLGPPVQIIRTLAPAVAGGHLGFVPFGGASTEEELAFARRTGVAQSVGPVAGADLLVTSQNGGANKLDYYLRRSIAYELETNAVDGDDALVDVRATVTIDLSNTAPVDGGGLPTDVFGPFRRGFEAGVNRSITAIYTPLFLQRATLDGVVVEMDEGVELGRNVYDGIVDIAAGSTRTLVLELDGRVALDDRRLPINLGRQPLVVPDRLTVKATGDVAGAFTGDLDQPRSLRL